MELDVRDRVLASIDRQEVVDLECALVAIPSYTTEEVQIAEFIAKQMQEFDLDARLQAVPLASGGVSQNVVGSLSGSDGPTLLLFGHMDHSPSLGRKYANFEGWKRDPFKPSVEGDWIYGKGCQDQKGGLCAMITAAKALVRAGFMPKGTIHFCGVQGHKRVSSGILHLLETGLRADYALNTENTGNSVVPLWIGLAEGIIHVRAPKLHFRRKEQVPELRSRKTAFEQLTRLLLALGPEMAPPGDDYWLSSATTPGLEGYPQIRIERVTFHKPGHLEISLQVRTVPGQTDGTIRADLERLVQKLQQKDPHFRADLNWPSIRYWPPGNTPISSAIVQSIARWHRAVTGEIPDVGPSSRLGAAADASHVVGQLGIPTILYGPGGGNSDLEWARRVARGELEPDERIRIDDIVVSAKVYALAAAELCG